MYCVLATVVWNMRSKVLSHWTFGSQKIPQIWFFYTPVAKFKGGGGGITVSVCPIHLSGLCPEDNFWSTQPFVTKLVYIGQFPCLPACVMLNVMSNGLPSGWLCVTETGDAFCCPLPVPGTVGAAGPWSDSAWCHRRHQLLHHPSLGEAAGVSGMLITLNPTT